MKKLSKKELKIYKEKLLNLREEVLSKMKEISEETLMKSQKDISGDISGYSLHLADMASDNYERDFNLGLISHEKELLSEIDDALKNIEENIYGICKICNKPISKVRLNAIPYVKFCKKCQEKIDKENKDNSV